MTDPLSSLPWKSKAPTPVIGKDEKLIADARHHWMKYLPSCCVYVFLFALCLLLIAFASTLPFYPPGFSIVVFFGALSVLVIVQHWFFHTMLSENTTDIILTNKRMLYLVHRLWLADSMDELVLQRIKMVEVHRRGIVRYLLNYGDLSCLFDVSAGKTFPFVPTPQTWAQNIERLISMG